MTTQQVIDYFAVLQDKYSSPNLLDDEVLEFVNNSINEYINRLLPDARGGNLNLETDKLVSATLRPLMFILPTITTTAGVLTNATIDAALVVASGNSSATHYRILSIAAGSVGYPVEYTRHNDYFTFKKNYFKQATITEPRYRQVEGGYPIEPVDNTIPLVVTVLKKPYILSLSPVVDPELEDSTMYTIIAIALGLAGVSTRDEEIIQDLRNISVQGK